MSEDRIATKAEARVDWLSFTTAEDYPKNGLKSPPKGKFEPFGNVLYLLGQMGDDHAVFEPSAGRFPYTGSFYNKLMGMRFYYGAPNQPNLIEISGQGCAVWHGQGRMVNLLRHTSEHASRIDLAMDIKTQTHPIEFASQRDHLRQRAFSVVESSTGTTVYVGSRKSDRYARVYRYNEPHPRADQLRVEMVHRRKDAKIVAGLALYHNIYRLAINAGETYGFNHPDWQNLITFDTAAIPKWRPERKKSKTLYWLVHTVFPLLRRLENENTIEDLRAFCDDYLFSPKEMAERQRG